MNLHRLLLLSTLLLARSVVQSFVQGRFKTVFGAASAHSSSFGATTDTSSLSRCCLASQRTSNEVPDSLKVRVVYEMPEPIPLDLKNQYYLLRHGQSTANVASIISSDRLLAYSDKHGLTPTGYKQGKESAKQLLNILRETTKPGEEVMFVSSPFARARQTAAACVDGFNEMGMQEVKAELGIRISTDVVLNDGLVERCFGKLDAEAIYTYSYVWPLDKLNVTHTAFNVESVAAVCSRIRDTVLGLEEIYQGKHIVLVSHADTLQIAKLYAARAENVGEFSSYRFQNGEVRRMVLGSTDHFPERAPLQGPKRCTKEKMKELKITWLPPPK